MLCLALHAVLAITHSPQSVDLCVELGQPCCTSVEFGLLSRYGAFNSFSVGLLRRAPDACRLGSWSLEQNRPLALV